MEQIGDIIKQKRYIRYCQKITGGNELAPDLLQHCAVRLLEINFKPDEKKGNLYSYFCITALNEWRNPCSKFTQLYKHNKEMPISTIFLESELEAEHLEDKSDTENIKSYIFDEMLSRGNIEPSRFRTWLDDFLSKPKTNSTDFFLNEIFLLYLDLRSTRKVAQVTGIIQTTISQATRTYIKTINDEYSRSCNH